jgi:hypothetical protein
MNFDRYSELINLLVLWHRLEDQPHVQGFPTECPSCRDFLTSAQWDWGAGFPLYEDGSDSNGAGETRERALKALVVGKTVDDMGEPHRTALRMFAKNRATGRKVWVSPRLPEDKDELAELVADALGMLAESV